MSNPIVSWNKFLTTIALKENRSLTDLVRDFAFLGVATYNAALTNKLASHETKRGLIAGAACEILLYLYPSQEQAIKDFQKNELENVGSVSDLYVGQGTDIGKKVVEYLTICIKKDDKYEIPKENCKWSGTDPLEPNFGNQKTLFVPICIVPSPYSCGSGQDLQDIKTVMEVSNKLCSNQITAIHKWQDLPTPIIWNNMLSNRIVNRNLGIIDSARAAAYLNASLYDACIICWHVKYMYWTARPFQRIPNFKPLIQTANFPGYVSEHSVLSAAASQIMSELFPSETNFFKTQANEASISRLWGGVQFPQDCQQGFSLGETVGKKIVIDMKNVSHYFLSNEYHPEKNNVDMGSGEHFTSTNKIGCTFIHKQTSTLPKLGNAFYNNTFPPRCGWRM